MLAKIYLLQKILIHYFTAVFQVFAMVISALTVTMTSIEVYFLDRDMMEKKSWQEIFRRNILVTPYFMTNTIFKILSMGLIFALFKTWGLLILILWTVFPLETRSFKKKQIFQEEQKTICAIIKPVLGIFF